jgi:hypothetical protein
MFGQKLVLISALSACLLCAHTLSGCAFFPFVIPAGLVQYQQGVAEADIPELAHRQDVIDLASRVGESLGYEVSLKDDDTIVLSNETVDYIEPVTGEYLSATIIVRKVQTEVKDNSPLKSKEDEIISRIAPRQFKNEAVHLSVYGGGIYYKIDNQQYVNKLMADFKDKLLTMSQAGNSNN